MKHFLILLALAGTLRAAELDRYQIIIDHSPFGSVSAAGAVQVTPGFAQRYQFVALVMSNAGAGPVQAIIFDREANRSFFRAQGESLDAGVKVERIETQPPKVILKSGLETAQLGFETRPAGPPMAVRPPEPTFRPGVPSIIRRIPFRRGN